MKSSSKIWTVSFSRESKKFIDKNKSILRQIKKAIDALACHPEPENLGKQLKGNLAEFYSYRTGDYRIIYQVDKGEIKILVFRIAHRKEVYRDKS